MSTDTPPAAPQSGQPLTKKSKARKSVVLDTDIADGGKIARSHSTTSPATQPPMPKNDDGNTPPPPPPSQSSSPHETAPKQPQPPPPKTGKSPPPKPQPSSRKQSPPPPKPQPVTKNQTPPPPKPQPAGSKKTPPPPKPQPAAKKPTPPPPNPQAATKKPAPAPPKPQPASSKRTPPPPKPQPSASKRTPPPPQPQPANSKQTPPPPKPQPSKDKQAPSPPKPQPAGNKQTPPPLKPQPVSSKQTPPPPKPASSASKQTPPPQKPISGPSKQPPPPPKTQPASTKQTVPPPSPQAGSSGENPPLPKPKSAPSKEAPPPPKAQAGSSEGNPTLPLKPQPASDEQTPPPPKPQAGSSPKNTLQTKPQPGSSKETPLPPKPQTSSGEETPPPPPKTQPASTKQTPPPPKTQTGSSGETPLPPPKTQPASIKETPPPPTSFSEETPPPPPKTQPAGKKQTLPPPKPQTGSSEESPPLSRPQSGSRKESPPSPKSKSGANKKPPAPVPQPIAGKQTSALQTLPGTEDISPPPGEKIPVSTKPETTGSENSVSDTTVSTSASSLPQPVEAKEVSVSSQPMSSNQTSPADTRKDDTIVSHEQSAQGHGTAPLVNSSKPESQTSEAVNQSTLVAPKQNSLKSEIAAVEPSDTHGQLHPPTGSQTLEEKDINSTTDSPPSSEKAKEAPFASAGSAADVSNTRESSLRPTPLTGPSNTPKTDIPVSGNEKDADFNDTSANNSSQNEGVPATAELIPPDSVESSNDGATQENKHGEEVDKLQDRSKRSPLGPPSTSPDSPPVLSNNGSNSARTLGSQGLQLPPPPTRRASTSEGASPSSPKSPLGPPTSGRTGSKGPRRKTAIGPPAGLPPPPRDLSEKLTPRSGESSPTSPRAASLTRTRSSSSMNLGPPEGLPPKEAMRSRSSSRSSKASEEGERGPGKAKKVTSGEVNGLDTQAESHSDKKMIRNNGANGAATGTSEQAITGNNTDEKSNNDSSVTLKPESSEEENIAEQSSKSPVENDEQAEVAQAHSESSPQDMEHDVSTPAEAPNRSGSSVAHRSSIFGGQVLRKTTKNKSHDAKNKEEPGTTLKDEKTSSGIKQPESAQGNDEKTEPMKGVSQSEEDEEDNNSSVEASKDSTKDESKDNSLDVTKTKKDVSAAVNQSAIEENASKTLEHLADTGNIAKTNDSDRISASLGTGELEEGITSDDGENNGENGTEAITSKGMKSSATQGNEVDSNTLGIVGTSDSQQEQRPSSKSEAEPNTLHINENLGKPSIASTQSTESMGLTSGRKRYDAAVRAARLGQISPKANDPLGTEGNRLSLEGIGLDSPKSNNFAGTEENRLSLGGLDVGGKKESVFTEANVQDVTEVSKGISQTTVTSQDSSSKVTLSHRPIGRQFHSERAQRSPLGARNSNRKGEALPLPENSRSADDEGADNDEDQLEALYTFVQENFSDSRLANLHVPDSVLNVDLPKALSIGKHAAEIKHELLQLDYELDQNVAELHSRTRKLFHQYRQAYNEGMEQKHSSEINTKQDISERKRHFEEQRTELKQKIDVAYQERYRLVEEVLQSVESKRSWNSDEFDDNVSVSSTDDERNGPAYASDREYAVDVAEKTGHVQRESTSDGQAHARDYGAVSSSADGHFGSADTSRFFSSPYREKITSDTSKSPYSPSSESRHQLQVDWYQSDYSRHTSHSPYRSPSSVGSPHVVAKSREEFNHPSSAELDNIQSLLHQVANTTPPPPPTFANPGNEPASGDTTNPTDKAIRRYNKFKKQVLKSVKSPQKPSGDVGKRLHASSTQASRARSNKTVSTR